MEIEYETTKDDLFAFQWRAVQRSAQVKRSRRKAYTIWFITLLLFSIIPSIGPDGFNLMRANFAFLAISFTMAAFLTWYFDRRSTRRVINELIDEEKPDKGLLGKHKIIMNEKEIVETSDVGESRTLWVGVDRVEQSDEHILIYTTPHAAHVIPKRAFANSKAAEHFWESANLFKQAGSA